MIKNIDVFEKDPVPKAVFKLAIPTVLSMIVTVFYNMVDTFFVGQIGDPNQVAAVSVATPVFLLWGHDPVQDAKQIAQKTTRYAGGVNVVIQNRLTGSILWMFKPTKYRR